jgi:cytochrome c
MNMIQLNKSTLCHALLALVLLADASHTLAADVKKGADNFAEECGDCHSPQVGKAKKGPPLFGVIGRKAGSVADFEYSDAMKQSGIVWTVEKIDAYITGPRKVVPGGKMKYDGLAVAASRADIVAFLQTLK